MKLLDVYSIYDIAIERAKGSLLWDEKGHQYLDYYGGHAVISIGHGHPHYVQRLTEQLGKIGFYSNSVRIPLQEQLAVKLANASGKTEYHLFLCNSGAEANENALKLASFHNGRRRIVAFSNGFHGRTSLAVAVTDNPKLAAPVNQQSGVSLLPYNDIEALEDFFRRMGNEISSVIVEGIQGVGGIREASRPFLQAIRRLCDQYGAVFVADTVQCGYGRSGHFFAHDQAAVEADIYTMAKGMGNGFPVAGMLVAPHIHVTKGMLGTTFGGNHLACAAALAVLEVIEQEQLMNHASSMGQYILDQLHQVPALTQVRGRGLMIGFDVPGSIPDLRERLLHRHRIFTGSANPNVIRLLPSLTISKEETDYLLEAIHTELETCSSNQ